MAHRFSSGELDLAGGLGAEADLSRKFQKELNAGLISLVLLALCDAANEDLYGYQIAKRLEALTPEGRPMTAGGLYPVLRSLSARKLLTSRVVPSYAGPARRYYRITPTGQAALSQWQQIWGQMRVFVDAALTTTGEPSS